MRPSLPLAVVATPLAAASLVVVALAIVLPTMALDVWRLARRRRPAWVDRIAEDLEEEERAG